MVVVLKSIIPEISGYIYVVLQLVGWVNANAQQFDHLKNICHYTMV